jgi:hypothetical protein
VRDRIPSDAEATAVLVGTMDELEKPAMAFVRLAKGCRLSNVTEVPLPVRFIFILLGPPREDDQYHEIGRSIATLMSDEIFHSLAYQAEEKEDILSAINQFLSDSIVLAPGDWDERVLLPLLEGHSREVMKKRRKGEYVKPLTDEQVFYGKFTLLVCTSYFANFFYVQKLCSFLRDTSVCNYSVTSGNFCSITKKWKFKKMEICVAGHCSKLFAYVTLEVATL